MRISAIRLLVTAAKTALATGRLRNLNVSAMRQTSDRAPVLGTHHAQKRAERNTLRPAVLGRPLHVERDGNTSRQRPANVIPRQLVTRLFLRRRILAQVIVARQQIEECTEIARTAFPAPHGRARDIDLEPFQGPETEAETPQQRVFPRAFIVEVFHERGQVPRAQPAQPFRFERRTQVSLQRHARSRPRVARQY